MGSLECLLQRSTDSTLTGDSHQSEPHNRCIYSNMWAHLREMWCTFKCTLQCSRPIITRSLCSGFKLGPLCFDLFWTSLVLMSLPAVCWPSVFCLFTGNCFSDLLLSVQELRIDVVTSVSRPQFGILLVCLDCHYGCGPLYRKGRAQLHICRSRHLVHIWTPFAQIRFIGKVMESIHPWPGCDLYGCRARVKMWRQHTSSFLIFPQQVSCLICCLNVKQLSRRTPAKNNLLYMFVSTWWTLERELRYSVIISSAARSRLILVSLSLSVSLSHINIIASAECAGVHKNAGCSESDGFMCQWPPAQQINGPLFIFYASERSTETLNQENVWTAITIYMIKRKP